jgi:hypothetical protein
MSYLDVKVLRRFTQKLAAGISTDATMGPGKIPLLDNEKGMYERYAEPAMGAVSGTADAAAAKLRHLTGNEIDPVAATRATMGVGHHPELNSSMTLGERAQSGMQAAKDQIKNVDLGHMAGVGGGAALGGLGAMGLANLFRSKEDEEKQQTPWLAGGLGALAGGAAGHYLLPQLIAAINGAKTAPGATGAAPTDPGAQMLELRKQEMLNQGQPVA